LRFPNIFAIISNIGVSAWFIVALVSLKYSKMQTGKSIVLITGVSREEGIGFGLAREMAARGFEVIITARDLNNSTVLARKISTDKNTVIAEQLDITNEPSVQQLAEFIKASYGRLDILINNAGGHLDYMVPPLASDFETVKAALDTNLFGTWRMIKEMYLLLKESEHPRIVNISSGAGSFSHPVFGLGVHPALLTAYGISKLALNGLTVQVARQVRDDKMIVNAVNPGFVATAEGMEAMGARPVAASVDAIIWAATLPDDGPTGCFFEDKKVISW
jgi:NAD(P)-dependent dehydrogenase (short-subunit alcohol dehydrogenase family)